MYIWHRSGYAECALRAIPHRLTIASIINGAGHVVDDDRLVLGDRDHTRPGGVVRDAPHLVAMCVARVDILTPTEIPEFDFPITRAGIFARR